MRRVLFVALACFALLTACASPNEPMPDKTADGVPPANAGEQQADNQPADDQPADDKPITDRMAKEHADDSPEASEAATTAPKTEVVGKQVQYAKLGQPINGYLAHPKGETKGLPAIIVIHEWWGLNDNIRAMTRRLAGEGYVALAVDLYDGKVAETPDKARQLMGTAMKNEKRALINLSAARQYLEKEYSPAKMGIIGWCFGGGWALRGALNMKDNVDAVVMYYGEVVTDPSKLADLKAPLLGLFGSEDQAITPAKVNAFEEALQKLNKNATIKIFEGANHAFANPSGQRYDKAAAEEAWKMTTAFFAEHLKGE